jgi:glycosyltransferase involved in cell wall biosynthesis
MRDGENGLLVDIDDDAGFAAAIAQILSDAQLARSLAEGGHRTLMAQFSEEAIAGAYIDLFGSRPR